MARPRTPSRRLLALAQFAVNVRAARIAGGLTQEQLAHRAHVSLRTVANWERGETRLPNDENLHALAEALGRDPEWFIERHEHNGDPVAA
jgi:transcriptional regulator with XRE-family HTH domain